MRRNKTLIAIPSPMEWKVLYPKIPFGKTVEKPLPLNARFDAACLGIGLVRFADSLLRMLLAKNYATVILAGVAGALPGSGLLPANTVRVDEECVADEGYFEGDSFRPYFRRPQIIRATSFRAAPPQIASLPGVRCASVNTLTAFPRALECRARFFGAQIEAMEGASAFSVANALGVKIFEVRTISNFTGDLDESRWNLRESLRALSENILNPIVRGKA